MVNILLLYSVEHSRRLSCLLSAQMFTRLELDRQDVVRDIPSTCAQSHASTREDRLSISIMAN